MHVTCGNQYLQQGYEPLLYLLLNHYMLFQHSLLFDHYLLLDHYLLFDHLLFNHYLLFGHYLLFTYYLLFNHYHLFDHYLLFGHLLQLALDLLFLNKRLINNFCSAPHPTAPSNNAHPCPSCYCNFLLTMRSIVNQLPRTGLIMRKTGH